MSKIFSDLIELKLSSKDSIKLFRNGTRDNKEIKVYQDSVSGIIFIKDHYVGDNEFRTGEYRIKKQKKEGKEVNIRNFECVNDYERRIENFKQFYIAKDIADFGCGYGDFLLRTRTYTKSSIGIELQEDLINSLKERGIECKRNLNEIDKESIDTLFMFHSLEHLPSPRLVLKELKSKIRPGGKIVIEVPHANDFLISNMREESFIDFTLWSQHLILHTFESLRVFLEDANFKDIVMKGVQRYSLSNHLVWLRDKKPGGHQSSLSLLDTPQLKEAYQNALAAGGLTDTILAVATV